MKKFLFSLTLFINIFVVHAQVGISDDTDDDFGLTPVANNTVLEVRSSNKGILVPRLSTSAINALSGEGMIVFDKDLNCFKGFANGTWQSLGEDCIVKEETD